MFELTISTSKTKEKDIDFIFSMLKNKIRSVKGIVVSEEVDGRVKLSLAVPQSQKEFAVSLTFDAIAESIVQSYKHEFLKRNLNFQTGNKMVESALIKALSVYDKKSDKDFIKSKLVLSSEILIDSFFRFRLWELEKRWKNIAELVRENMSFLCMNGSLVELMRFLVMSNECEIGELHIHVSDGIVHCHDLSGEELFNMVYDPLDETSKINILTELISLSPEKIVIHQEDADCDIASEIVNVFERKVCVVKK